MKKVLAWIKANLKTLNIAKGPEFESITSCHFKSNHHLTWSLQNPHGTVSGV